MARVQYGTIVTEIKGKVHGQVFQGGNVGYVLRNKGYVPGNPSQRKIFAVSRVTSCASLWRTLTDMQRSQWEAIAPDWLFYNKYGQSYQGNGYQIFNAYNAALLNTGNTIDLTPNAVSSPIDPGLMDVFTDGVGSLLFERENNGSNTEVINVFGAAPQSAGRNTNHNRYKIIANLAGNAGVSVDIFSAYTAVYPTYAAGQRLTIKVAFRKISFPYAFFTTVLTCIAADPSA